jgi:predicted transcriptional regulator
MKTFEYFKQKETAIKNAIEKVETKLKWFKENQESLSYDILETWNNWHDLHDRLKDRLFDNYGDYQSYNFKTYGIAVY